MTYKITIEKNYTHFCAAHFIIFDEKTRELLHGHNYYVSLIITGDKLYHSKLYDVAILKKELKSICDVLDHKTILPNKNKFLIISATEKNVSCVFNNTEKFEFPSGDVVIIDFENTTMEILAKHIFQQLEKKLHLSKLVTSVEIKVEETKGQSASYLSEF